MFTERCVVDNKVFLLGLDKLYRDAMKPHERGELLKCARRVAETLREMPPDVPVEGYYAEDEQLREYFCLLRALQSVDIGAASLVDSLPEYRRLVDVTSAPLFGRAQSSDKLLPVGRDPLSQALIDTFPAWTVATLAASARNIALETDDISLVGLAARVKETVVLAAVRESVVLYAEAIVGAAPRRNRSPKYVWKVDEDLVQHARRFINTFNTLFGEELPPPDATQAILYWRAYLDNEIVGRCIRLGSDNASPTPRHYHWGIRRAFGELELQEFWKHEVWTTARYRSTLRGN